MKINKNAELLAGFYTDEGFHIWGGDNVFLFIKNAKYKTARFVLTLGKGNKLDIINCCRNEYHPYTMHMEDAKMIVDIDLTDDAMLLNFRTPEYLQPNIDCPGSDDCRRLGICFYEIQIGSGGFEKLIKNLKTDKSQTLFNLENFNKRYVHEPDFRFLELFVSMELPGFFLDIGANIGQSACSIASVHPSVKIVSYEPNKLLEKNLEIVKRILNGRMDYRLCGIGAKNEKKDFYIPKYGDDYFTQEGSFLQEEASSAESRKRIEASLHMHDIKIELEEMEFETTTLNENPVMSYFVKIDTQGYEKDSIIGLNGVILNCQPVILIEKGFHESDINHLLPNYLTYYYDAENKKFTKSDTGTANVFLIHKEGTKNSTINEILFHHLEL